ncbi:MAG: hypothetical protein P1P82_11065 [Bacteroidales bacterium]|nr:hypothetical protein [Bacteroidales bacterium]
MRRILLMIIAGLLLVAALSAQDKTLNIYRTNGEVKRFALGTVDSILVDTTEMMLRVFRVDGSLRNIAITTIDSMNYTSDEASLPEVHLLSADYDRNTKKATCVLEIVDDGGCDIYEKGICWSTAPDPTIENLHQTTGGTFGSYYGSTSALPNGRKYYIRAYASNCMGTVYSEAIEVKTLSGNVTYTLAVDPDQYPEYHQLLTAALDSACYFYNAYATFDANIYVYYNAGIPTAQANYHGSIGFGPNTSYMWVGTVMHEMAHYFGSGTTAKWQSLMQGGVWQGATAQALCQQLTGSILRGDNNANPIHYWPTGINYRNEVSSVTDLVNHAKIVQAMLIVDCGLPASW